MARYLVVAHRTATSPLLLQRAQAIAELDREAAFTLLVPETHVAHGLVCDEAETRRVAIERGEDARRAFERAGLRVAGTAVGDPSPVLAIEDELRVHPGLHDAIVLSTFAPGASRWLRLDVPTRVEQKFSLPVLHVFEGGEAVWAATEPLRRELAAGERPSVSREVEAVRPASELTGTRLLAAIGALLVVHLLFTGMLTTRGGEAALVAVALVLTFALLAASTILLGRGTPGTRSGTR